MQKSLLPPKLAALHLLLEHKRYSNGYKYGESTYLNNSTNILTTEMRKLLLGPKFVEMVCICDFPIDTLIKMHYDQKYKKILGFQHRNYNIKHTDSKTKKLNKAVKTKQHWKYAVGNEINEYFKNVGKSSCKSD